MVKGLSAFSSWSGGKDSCLALYRSLKAGNRVAALLTMMDQTGAFVPAHGTPRTLLERQAEAMGIPARFGRATWESYEAVLKQEVTRLKADGVEAGIFGDIDLIEHRDWIERVCRDLAIAPLLPLWSSKRRDLVEEFIDLGFQAVIVCIRAEVLSPEWLGRTLDHSAVRALAEHGVDPAGEGGEFHTFVYAGPLFHHPVDFSTGGVEEGDGHVRLKLR